MKLKNAKTVLNTCKTKEDLPKSYLPKYRYDEYGRPIYDGLDLNNPESFDLGTANPLDELGYARYLQTMTGSETEQSGISPVDSITAMEQGFQIQEQIKALKD